MRLRLIFSIIALTSFSSFAQQTIDKIAAQVGDKVILLSDIQAQKIQAIQAGITVTPEMDCEMLEELMYQKLLITQAILDSVEVSPEQVDSEMESRLRVIENQIGGRQEMENFYGKTVAQIKNEFRPIIKEQLMAREMEYTISNGISVTPREVKTFYSKIPSDSLPYINTQLSFQQIVIYPEITRKDKDIARAKLEKIRKDIMAGKTFSTQARIHSMDPGSAQDGGKIQASKGMMVKPFESVVFALKQDEVSEVFETEYGFHIIKLGKRLGDDYTCQHILIVAEFSGDAVENAAMRLDSCYQLLDTEKITWDAAVKEFSNDETTKQNKGIITNPATGEQTWDMEDLNQIDQQIYLLTTNMEKGDISEPNLYTNIYERKQGVRIVRLMDTKAPHKANLKDDYALIKRAAENEKKQMMINDWVISRINTTYISINDPFEGCEFTNPWKKD
ncbi:MAG: peptidylprolyl isomerase [Crocinitomicaceae bacterium]|nr:peptidylprolyl isomerase [Crocinitomicaceae bacterium]MDG1659547.1 peptidylprolyl isomerase [Crocinitomicaceae bacterium]